MAGVASSDSGSAGSFGWPVCDLVWLRGVWGDFLCHPRRREVLVQTVARCRRRLKQDRFPASSERCKDGEDDEEAFPSRVDRVVPFAGRGLSRGAHPFGVRRAESEKKGAGFCFVLLCCSLPPAGPRHFLSMDSDSRFPPRNEPLSNQSKA